MMKALGSPPAPDSDVDRTVAELVPQEKSQTPKRKQGSERVMSCPPHCDHSASLPSDIIVEMKVFFFVLVLCPAVLCNNNISFVILFSFFFFPHYVTQFTVKSRVCLTRMLESPCNK